MLHDLSVLCVLGTRRLSGEHKTYKTEDKTIKERKDSRTRKPGAEDIETAVQDNRMQNHTNKPPARQVRASSSHAVPQFIYYNIPKQAKYQLMNWQKYQLPIYAVLVPCR